MALVMPADSSTMPGTLKNQYTFGTIDMKFIPQFFSSCGKFAQQDFVVSAP